MFAPSRVGCPYIRGLPLLFCLGVGVIPLSLPPPRGDSGDGDRMEAEYREHKARVSAAGVQPGAAFYF